MAYTAKVGHKVVLMAGGGRSPDYVGVEGVIIDFYNGSFRLRVTKVAGSGLSTGVIARIGNHHISRGASLFYKPKEAL